MPININDPEYVKAEKEYYDSENLEAKITALKKMISHMPGHKGAENLRAQLKTRLKKFLEKQDKSKKTGKGGKAGIKKEDMQAVIIGKTNSGKSSLLKLLTNAEPKISQNKFATTQPVVGMMSYATTSIQIIEIPAIDSDYYDKGIVYTADTILILINSLEEIKEIEKQLKTNGKKIIVFNKIDLFTENEKRKTQATLKSKYKKYDFVLISTKKELEERAISRNIFAKPNLEDSSEVASLKNKLFQSFNKLRVYTKEPGKKPDKNRPMILEQGQTIKDVAEKILKGFSQRIKQIKIWGPSSKFSGQVVGLKHKIKDLDIVEFKTK
jgi:hypothetical protein